MDTTYEILLRHMLIFFNFTLTPVNPFLALDPCLDVTCEKFAVCRAYGPYDARCVCVTDCPLVEQNVCASNGQNFTNVCFFQLEVCQTKANYTYYHHGSCRGNTFFCYDYTTCGLCSCKSVKHTFTYHTVINNISLEGVKLPFTEGSW